MLHNCDILAHWYPNGSVSYRLVFFSPQGFVIELLLTLESGIDTLADTVKNYDLLTALAQ